MMPKRLLPSSVMVFLIMTQAVQANERIEDELRKVNEKMQIRQQRIDDNLARIDKQRIRVKPVTLPSVSSYFKPHGRKLSCLKKMFSWGGKKPEYQYEDCEFKMNIADPHDIDAMYAMLHQRKQSGWEIEKNETHKQDLISDTKIVSIERYRFKKLK